MTATAKILHSRFLMLSVLLLGGTLGLAGPASATLPEDMSYWISMRGITEDAQPSFVSLSYTQTGTYTVPFLGCHNRTYYLQSTDANAVSAARAAGETVQIHRGEPGTAPQQGTVICLIQADQ
jgi:hypothetical protein